jgi:hypothetical protein
MQRWARGKNTDLANDPNATLITPMTGMSYQVRPAQHGSVGVGAASGQL